MANTRMELMAVYLHDCYYERHQRDPSDLPHDTDAHSLQDYIFPCLFYQYSLLQNIQLNNNFKKYYSDDSVTLSHVYVYIDLLFCKIVTFGIS